MMDRTRAEQAIAFLVHQIRDEWQQPGVASVLRKCSEKPLAETVAAALYCATYRTDQRNPACIALDGEHWHALERMTGKEPGEPTYTPPAATERTCPTHGDRMPCRGCAADAKALADSELTEVVVPRLEGESLAAWAKRIAGAES